MNSHKNKTLFEAVEELNEAARDLYMTILKEFRKLIFRK